MTAILPIRKAEALEAEGQGWRTHLVALGAAAAAILLLFYRDAAGMVGVWLESETFNHCALILPIIGWLVWQRLPELRRLQPSAWAPGLLLTGAGAAAWLPGYAGSVTLARHAGWCSCSRGQSSPASGKSVSRALAFPDLLRFLPGAGRRPARPAAPDGDGRDEHGAARPRRRARPLEGVFITTPSGYSKSPRLVQASSS
jgi:hypothetical protein